jgi:hypothetical protein
VHIGQLVKTRPGPELGRRVMKISTCDLQLDTSTSVLVVILFAVCRAKHFAFEIKKTLKQVIGRQSREYPMAVFVLAPLPDSLSPR